MPAQTIFVGSLPASASNQRLEEIFSEVGPVKQCFVVKEKGAEKCRGFGYVTFAMEEDAQRAMSDIKEYDGQRISLSVAKKKMKDKKKAAPTESAAAPTESAAAAPTEPAAAPKQQTEQKSKGLRKNTLKARLIIRNLSFKCSEDELKQTLSKFGTVLEAKIPLKPDGKMRGFAFAQFKTVAEAGKALNALNLKEIKGRQVAIDWAVPKDKFVATQPSTSAVIKNTEKESANQPPTQSDSEEEEEEEEEKQEARPKKKVISKPAVQQKVLDDEDDSDAQDSGEEEEDDKEEEEDDASQEGEDDDKNSLDSNDDDDDNDDEDDDDDDEDDEDDDDDDEENEKLERKKSLKNLPSDVNEGRTIFIRNLSFDTEEEGLEEVLLRYGEVNYIKVVLHPDTDHSKGCAFAQFKTKEAADKCMAASEDESEDGGIRVDGRKLLIVAAVTRDDAAKLKIKKTAKVETGTRNLYLAREGLIRAGTKAAEGVPEADMTKRTRFEEMKRTKLRDIGVFVSKTRLCVHNLPKSVDNKKLKALCLQAVKGSKGVFVTECRVMYDRKPQKGQAMGQSLGYGFVQFRDHEHALGTLRFLNNNPDIFGSHKRPIVEFSLEDSRKLKIKEMRHQNNKNFSQNRPSKGMSPQSQAPAAEKGPNKGGMKPSSSFQPARQERAPPQAQKSGRNFSGFQTNPEVEHVDLKDGKKRRKVLPLPTHRGPKIRMRDKGKQQAPPPKKPRNAYSRKDRQRQQKPKQHRAQNVKAAKGHRGGDRFDSLVEQYKKKLMGNGDKNAALKRNKWFDS
ncbi:RNA-binding protein 28 [Genypterus blacodes]|uniref:RNA-binding protein 28 n=1 Tax=Genypterus blacodes TaxID=154954 RepID=UPI003F76D959